jgi:transposase
VRQFLCEIANSARKTNSQFNGMYKGLVIRRGHKRTIVALGHKILEVVWAMLKSKEPYIDQCVDYEAMAVHRNAPRWIKALKRYGYWPVQAQVN